MIWLYNLFANSATHCLSKSLFDVIPTWYEYLPSTIDAKGNCAPALGSLNDIWLIVAAIIDILLRIAAILAVIFIIYAGILYTTSQGSPETTSKAKNTIVNALIGLALSIVASILVSFLAKQF